jgi:hypothetical protein
MEKLFRINNVKIRPSPAAGSHGKPESEMSWGTFTGVPNIHVVELLISGFSLPPPNNHAGHWLTAARMVTRLDKGVDKGLFEEVFHLMIVSLD